MSPLMNEVLEVLGLISESPEAAGSPCVLRLEDLMRSRCSELSSSSSLLSLFSCRPQQLSGECRHGPDPENNGSSSESKYGVNTALMSARHKCKKKSMTLSQQNSTSTNCPKVLVRISTRFLQTQNIMWLTATSQTKHQAQQTFSWLFKDLNNDNNLSSFNLTPTLARFQHENHQYVVLIPITFFCFGQI